jgi:hypothetical protein
VHDIKQGMSSMEESIFRHVDWGANSVVHVLAKEACTHVTNKTWWHSVPPCISGIIRKEELHPLFLICFSKKKKRKVQPIQMLQQCFLIMPKGIKKMSNYWPNKINISFLDVVFLYLEIDVPI